MAGCSLPTLICVHVRVSLVLRLLLAQVDGGLAGGRCMFVCVRVCCVWCAAIHDVLSHPGKGMHHNPITTAFLCQRPAAAAGGGAMLRQEQCSRWLEEAAAAPAAAAATTATSSTICFSAHQRTYVHPRLSVCVRACLCMLTKSVFFLCGVAARGVSVTTSCLFPLLSRLHCS